MAAASQSSLSSTSTSFAFDAAFPPLPSRLSPPIPPDPPPPPATSTLSDKPSDDNLRSEPSDPDLSSFIPPIGNRTINTSIPSSSNASYPLFIKKDYASLFNSLPRNAGVFKPQNFDIPRDGIPKDIPETVRAEGMNYWSDYLVGFFLDGTSSYPKVVNFLNRYWKLIGDVSIKSDGQHFYFKFSNESDREKILKADPIFINGRMFIITRWDPSIGNSQAQIRKVPVWVHFYCIPTILWTLLGINWLACHVGRLICFDSSTERLQRFRYAKALIEISSEFELPDKIVVGGLGKDCPSVKLKYDWRPKICTVCKVFGHETENCEFNANAAADGGIYNRDLHHNNIHEYPQQVSRRPASNANLSNWIPASSKNPKFWRKRGVQGDKPVNTGDRAGKNNENPFNVLETTLDDNCIEKETNEHDQLQSKERDNTNGTAHANEVRFDAHATSGIERGHNDIDVGLDDKDGNSFDAHATTSNDKDGNNFDESDELSDGQTMFGSIFDSNTHYVEQATNTFSGSSSAGESSPDLSTPNSTMSCSSTFSQSLPPSSVANSLHKSSTSSAKVSPYAHLKPPQHITLPPAMVTGCGLTFPPINASMSALSSALSSGSQHSSKTKKLKGKFWDDTDLDEGKEYLPEDTYPLNNKLKSSKRHTRKNPGPLFDPTFK